MEYNGVITLQLYVGFYGDIGLSLFSKTKAIAMIVLLFMLNTCWRHWSKHERK